MFKKGLWSIIVILVLWLIVDFIFHQVLLVSTYEATANLWRAPEEMSIPLMHSVALVFIICFVAIYGLLIKDKCLATGLKFGLLLGIASGVTMGLGSYSYMPIPLSLGLCWMASRVIEMVIAGLVVGLIMKNNKSQIE